MKISKFYAYRLTIVLLSVCLVLLFLFSVFLTISVSFYLSQNINLLAVILLFSAADVLMLSLVLAETVRLLKFKRIIRKGYSVSDCEILGVKVIWPLETVVIKVNDQEVTVSPWLFIRSYSSFIFRYKTNMRFKCLSCDNKYYLIRE